MTDHVAEAEEKDIPTNTTHARTTKQLLMVTHVQALNFQEENEKEKEDEFSADPGDHLTPSDTRPHTCDAQNSWNHRP